MEAKSLDELRNQKSAAGLVARALVFVHSRVRPPRPYRTRNQEEEVFRRHLGGRGDVAPPALAALSIYPGEPAMAAAFEPKFVDLVRNFTSTSGTGSFVLGNAVAGFSNLATALTSARALRP